MKRFYSTIIALVATVSMMAQGWPSNYGGVMLQGFSWDSYVDTQWSNLESQADELSQYFNLIWVPQSGNCNTSHNVMGCPCIISTRTQASARKRNCAP